MLTYGDLWGPMRAYVDLWGPMGSYGGPMGAHDDLWGPMGTFGDLWVPMGRKNTRTTQQLLLLPEEVKHIAPIDMLGTSGTGKAMKPWREGWFLYLSLVDGRKKEIM